MTEKKQRRIGLRISEKTIEEIKLKGGEDSPEYQLITTLREANVSYGVISNMLNMNVDYVRDAVTMRRRFHNEEDLDRVCVRFKKVIDRAMDEGLLPCTDVAVIEPILRLTLRVMALGNK